jgi:hypothetical protein
MLILIDNDFDETYSYSEISHLKQIWLLTDAGM